MICWYWSPIEQTSKKDDKSGRLVLCFLIHVDLVFLPSDLVRRFFLFPFLLILVFSQRVCNVFEFFLLLHYYWSGSYEYILKPRYTTQFKYFCIHNNRDQLTFECQDNSGRRWFLVDFLELKRTLISFNHFLLCKKKTIFFTY